jgi:glycine C-acetyltransferase/8-amino-7-oxononanoate synthase
MPPYLMQSPPCALTLINDRWRDYFAGTGYLGLQGHPALTAAAAEAMQRYGLGTGTSRGGFGEHPLYHEVEQAAARFFGVEQALYLTSGFLGASILLQGLRGSYDIIFVDEAAHTSIWSGARAAGVPVTAFRHLAADDLASHCAIHVRAGQRPLVISDGVFPISGEIAPVPAYVDVLSAYDGALLCLDDAHASGVLGAHGRGTVEYWAEQAGLASDGAIYTSHTLSKALAGFGGVLGGDAAQVARIRANAPAFVAASPPPLPAAAASAAALDLSRSTPELRARLRSNVALARQRLRRLGWQLDDTPVPILCLAARPGVDLARVQAELFARDICVAHVTSYSSTPVGGALRIAIFASHTAEQIERLSAEMERLVSW